MKSHINFFSLHSHTGFSTFDGLSYPVEHFDFTFKNGMDGMAITEHGHMNSYVYCLLASKELNKKGKKFRYLPGAELYIHPDLQQWRSAYANREPEKKKEKVDEETATVENEEETKSNTEKNFLKKRNHLIVIPKSQKGLNNLFALVSAGYKDGFYRFPRIDYSLLKRYGEDLIVNSACCGGNLCADVFEEFPGISFDLLSPALIENEFQMNNIIGRMSNTLDKVVDAVGIENTFIEIQFNKLSAQHLANKCLIELSKRTGIKLIAASDSHYPTPDHWKDRELYKKIGWLNFNKFEFGKLPESKDELKADLYPKNGIQMWESYKETSKNYDFYDDQLVLEAIERTHDIAFNLVGNVEPDTKVKLPAWVVPKDKSSIEKLKDLAFDGLKYRGFDKNPAYINRINEELELIQHKGLENYFLTMQDIISIAEKEVLINHGRGSAASSLVCFCLRITNIDPIRYNLPFSRFINKYRKGMPDIDTDFSDRTKVVELLKEKYGNENVLNITNINTFRVKSLVKDISRFYQIPFEEVNEATKTIDKDVAYKSQIETGEKNINPTFSDAMKYSDNFRAFIRKYPIVENHISVLFKQVKTVGTHAGGVILCDDILKRMPAIVSKGKLQTPWSESGTITHLEEMGWIKFDILGLSTLKIIENCIKQILVKEGNREPTFSDIRKWYDKNLDPNVLDLDDQKVYKHVYHDGNFPGIFQFTEQGVQTFIKKVKPTCIDDISAVTSIFRPGPLGSQMDDLFLKNKNNQLNIKYDHPLIEKVLRNTYGCLVYQEQIMALANVVGNIALDDCDDVRRAISKKPEPGSEAEKKLFELQEKFINGSVKNGLNRKKAEDLFEMMKKFAKYSFNSSHSYCYSILSYQCAWLFTYNPAEWLCAFLDNEPDDSKNESYAIVTSLGFRISNIDINKSGTDWVVDPDDPKTLIPPLTSIKGLGEKGLEQIMANRPFNNIEELLFNENIKYNKLNKKCIDVLIRSEACICLMDERFKHWRHFWLCCASDRPKTKDKLLENIEKYKDEKDFTSEEKTINVFSLTQMFPLKFSIDDKTMQRLRTKKIPSMSEYHPEIGIGWFVPLNKTDRLTKKNKNYWEIEVTDGNKNFRIKCWDVRKNDAIFLYRPYLAKLEYSDEWGWSIKSPSKCLKLIG